MAWQPRDPSHPGALGPGNAGPSMANPRPGTSGGNHSNVLYPTCGAKGFSLMPQAGNGQPHRHTQDPYVTGTSVLGIKYKDGVMLAADTLGSYGSTKRYKSVDRLIRVNDTTVLGASGELSDLAYIITLLEELASSDFVADDGEQFTAPEIHSYLQRVLYNRRNKFDPLWNSLVVGGVENDGSAFLGMVGMIGTAYTDDHIATGFGNHLARPLFRERHRPDMSEAEAEELLHDALRVCFYRDKQSINKFRIIKATKSGVTTSEPFALQTNWDFKAFVNPTAHAIGAW